MPHCAASLISQKRKTFTEKARSNYTKGRSAYLCRHHTTLDRLQLVSIAHLPPRAQIHQCAMRQNQQSGTKRVRMTRKEETTHLQVCLVVHESDPCQLAAPCRPRVVNAALLSLTIKSTGEALSEKSGGGKQESASARIHPRNTILSSHIHSHNPRSRPPTRTHTTTAARRRAPRTQTRGHT